LGTILSMQISFVGFQPIQSSEHMAALGVFGLCQLISFYEYAKSKLSAEQFEVLFRAACVLLGGAVGLAALVLTITGSNYNL
jgi:dolichyl-diphosphooligosaccharide--protein glycosyltransferase